MESNLFYKTFGRKIPYKVPVDFFDTIIEDTLRKAKKRRRQAKVKHLVVWLSAAASVLIIVTLALLSTNLSGGKSKLESVAKVESESVDWRTEQSESDSKSDSSYEPVDEKQDADFNGTNNPNDETLENLLASMSEEELQVVIRQISAELYLNELIEE